MKKLMVAAFIAAVIVVQSQAQQITNSGYGIAGNGIAGTSPRYSIDISDDGNWIVINGKWWPILPYSGQSPYAQIMKWDAFKGKYVPFGMIKCKTDDGTQFLGGTILIKDHPTMNVVSFKAIGFYTPKVMPTVNTSSLVSVYVYSPFTRTFVPRPDLNINTTFLSGAIWLNGDYTEYAGVFDGGSSYGLNIVQPPGGLGSHGTNGVYPTWLL